MLDFKKRKDFFCFVFKEGCTRCEVSVCARFFLIFLLFAVCFCLFFKEGCIRCQVSVCFTVVLVLCLCQSVCFTVVLVLCRCQSVCFIVCLVLRCCRFTVCSVLRHSQSVALLWC